MVTYLTPKYESYTEIEAACQNGKAKGCPFDELKRFARAYGEKAATQLWRQHIARTILEHSNDTYGQERKAWNDMLACLKRNAANNNEMLLYWLKLHAASEYRRVRSPKKRSVYAWCEQYCKPVRPDTNVYLCAHCGYDRVYGTGLCVNCGNVFEGGLTHA